MREKPKEVLEEEKISCTFAGRIVALRRFGKAGFAVLQDGSDRLQVYLKKDHLSEQALSHCRTTRLGRLDRRDRHALSHEDQ